MADSEVRQKFEAWTHSEEARALLMAELPLYPSRLLLLAFEAGMRAGEIAMREKAANCAAEVYLGRHDALDIAQMIRALPAAPEEKP